MKYLSITKVKYSNENDLSFKFIMTLQGQNILFDDNEITINYDNGKKISTSFNKKEEVALAGQTHYHFKINGHDLRLILMNELAKKLHGKQDSLIIASKRHDNFAIYFDFIDASMAGLISPVTQLKMHRFENKNIEFIKITPNPLKIVDNDPFGTVHRVPDLTSNYAKLIHNALIDLQQVKGQVTYDNFYEMVGFYAIELLIYYQKNAQGILPRNVVTSLSNQIAKASTVVISNIEEDTVVKVIDAFTKTYDVIEQLEQYKIDNKMQDAFDA